MGVDISEKNTIKLHSYYLDEEKRFCNKILLTNILSGSNIKENLDLEPGLFLDKINDEKIQNIQHFRQKLLNLFKDSPDKPIKLLFDNNSFIITNLKESCEQEKITNEKFNYKATPFLNKLNSLYCLASTGEFKLPIEDNSFITNLDQSFIEQKIIGNPIDYDDQKIQDLNKDIEKYNSLIESHNLKIQGMN